MPRKLKPSRIVFASSEDGDWIGLYIDGVLVDEGHSIPAERAVDYVLGALGHDVSDGRSCGAWLSDDGHLPRTLEALDARIAECAEAEKGS